MGLPEIDIPLIGKRRYGKQTARIRNHIGRYRSIERQIGNRQARVTAKV